MSDRTRTAPPPAPRAPGPATFPMLWVAHHPDPRWIGHVRPLEDGLRLELGRHDAALAPGLFSDDEEVSRRHTALAVRGNSVRVRDLESRNGTWVNGARVDEARLSDGDTLRLGGVLLLLRCGPLPSGARAQTPGWLGVSAAHRALIEALAAVAETESPVALLGETGVGKGRAAEELHARSGRTGPLVPVNCGGVSDDVLHSELFGHARGAFTGAERSRGGLIDAARGGTLFLDEIGDASPVFQRALLRVLEEQVYRPVGADRTRKAEVRIVVATHRDLEREASTGGFRLDLWMRLNRWTLRIAPLRERPEDIGVLTRHFAGSHTPTVPLMEALLHHPWRGNVRELAGVVERLCADAGPSGLLQVPPWLHAPEPEPTRRPRARRPEPAELHALLVRTEGNVRAAAKALGVGRNTLYGWLRDAGLELKTFR